MIILPGAYSNRSALDPAVGGGAFDPLDLYSGGDTGFYFNFSDLSTMKQTTGGATAVSANNDPVGHITDLFGSRVMAASADGRRPLYSTAGGLSGILFDGTDDCLVGSAAWDFSGSVPEGTLVVSMIDDTAATTSYMVVESSATSGTNANSIGLFVGGVAAGDVFASANGDGANQNIRYTGTHTRPFTAVNLARFDLDGGSSSGQITAIRVNATGESLSSFADYASASHYGNHTWYLGARGNSTLRFKGTVFAVLFITRTLDATETSNLETYFGTLAGLSI